MAGIGDYEEGKPFSLKSGNKPEFKVMGSDSPLNGGIKHFTTSERPRTDSPNQLNNFGLSPGDSPYKQEDDTGNGGDGDDGNGDGEGDGEDTTIDAVKGEESGWKKALKIGVAGLTGGLDAVYGSGKVVPLISHFKKKKEIEANPISDDIKANIADVSGVNTVETEAKKPKKEPK